MTSRIEDDTVFDLYIASHVSQLKNGNKGQHLKPTTSPNRIPRGLEVASNQTTLNILKGNIIRSF